MAEEHRIAFQGGMGEIILKKSKFIATTHPIETEDAALAFIDKMRKKYWNATHNCFAYVIGKKNEIQRYSDDGEPSGTAGKPILDVVLGEEIHNVAVVVTRYFGGTLLGTGGLVKAYANATKEGIKNSIIVDQCLGKKYSITTDYVGIGKLQYIVGQMGLISLDTEYTDIVKATVLSPIGDARKFEEKVIEATSGSAMMDILGEIYYGEIDGEVIILDGR